jgi:mRNA interferase RelE/StbE
MYRLEVHPKAQKDLHRLRGDLLRRVATTPSSLRETPPPAGCKKLRGGEGLYRVRIGDVRAMYLVDDEAKLVRVLRVEHRKDVYREL